MQLIDTNVHLSRWPFRRLALEETPALVAKLRQFGVTQAWAGSYDALLHKDLSAVNARLAAECREHGAGLLLPFGCVNPSLPDWEGDLRRCAEEFGLRGIRVYPNYHGFALDDERGRRLFALAAERGLLVQIAVMMEEERTQHPLVRVPVVNVAPLPGLLTALPMLRVQLLNSFRAVRGPLAVQLAATRRVFLEINTLEGVAGVEELLKLIPDTQLLFGSGAPFYIFESAVLKLRESRLTATQLAALTEGNARRLLPAVR